MGRTNLMKLDIQYFAAVASISCTTLSQSIANNTSTIRITFTVTRTSGTTWWQDYRTATITCDGQSKTAQIRLLSNEQSGSCYADFTVSHNANGTKSVSYTGYVYVGTQVGDFSASGSTNLPTIPRYANITSFTVSKRDETSVKYNWSADAACDYAWYSTNNGSTWSALPSNNIITGLSAGTTYNFKLRVRRTDSQLTTDSGTVAQSTYNYPYVSSAPNFIIGDTITIGLYNPLNRTFTVDIKCGQNLIETLTVIPESSHITQPTIDYDTSEDEQLWYQQILNNTSGTYTATATYSTHTTASKSATFSVDTTTSVPTFNLFEWEDVNPTTLALTGDSSTVVLGYSNIEATISTSNKAQANNEATMSYYLYECGGQSTTINYSDSESVSGTINKATSGSFKVSAVDSRGLSTPITLNSQNIINYSNLVKGEANISRVGEVSEQAELEFEGDMWVGNFGYTTNDIVNVTYRYKTGDNDWTTGTTVITPTIDQNGHFSFSGLIKGDTNTGFDEANVYTIEFTVYDKLSSVTYTVTLAAGKPHLAWYKDGLAVMGKYDENRDDALQVFGNLNIIGNLLTYGSQFIETGNGYIRIKTSNSGGIQICWGIIEGTTNVNSTWGNIYSSGSVGIGEYFPVEFSSIPALTCSPMVGKSSANSCWYSTIVYDKTQITSIQIHRATAATSYKYQFPYIAIGTYTNN